jgi:hypothetical protein
MAIAKALPRDLDQASFCQEAVASRAGWLGDALRQRSQPEEDDAMQMQCKYQRTADGDSPLSGRKAGQGRMF